MKKLGIIIAAYNTGDSIVALLDEIARQMTEAVEVIVIDDGSVDNTLESAKQFCSRGMTVLHQENAGAGPARNYGIEESSAEYLWFVDADDEILPNAINDLLTAIENDPSDMFLFGFEKQIGTKITRVVNSKNCTYGSASEIAQNFDSIFKYNLLNPLWNKLIRKSILDSHHLRFSDMRRGQDADFILRCLPHIRSMSVMNRVLYRYVLGSSSSLGSRYRKDFLDMRIHLENLLNSYCKESHAVSTDFRAQWTYDVIMGFYKNIYNGLENKYNLWEFYKQISANKLQLKTAVAILRPVEKSKGIRGLLMRSPLLTYFSFLIRK